ncbi:hypothetical protein GCM10009716_27120 [Streptomyces sodiiphilus]|uniref:Type VII secretion system protein EccE domain-containing protein n=1 Tax=Streptomyces sodiiphilus TaxID=226217 RepID=A0ABN2PBC5_9ACTN
MTTSPPPAARPGVPRFGRARAVAVQTAAACAATGIAAGGLWGHTLTGTGAALLALSLLRRDGRWADHVLRQRLHRDALRAVPHPAPGEDSEGLGLARALLPALHVTEAPDRNGPPAGVIADGRGHAVVLRLPGGALPSLPAGPIGRWLEQDPARPAAAQLVVEQFGLPPWDLHHRFQPTIAYRQLPQGGAPVAVRSWLVVRHEPLEHPEAAERRGGGTAGAAAAALSAAHRLRARLDTAGTGITVLGADAARALLRDSGDASPRGRALPGCWAGDAATHCTMTAAVHGEADWDRLTTALTGCAADRVVTAATVTRQGSGQLRVHTAVRVVSTLAQHAAAERDRLLGAGIVSPATPDQAAGLLATLPVAHPTKSLAEAIGFATAAGEPR